MAYLENGTVNTVLGPVPADQLGVVSVHEALLSVLPGAEHAYDITMDRAEIFAALAAKLTDFRNHGGQTIVDSTGMFAGRDLRLYESLSRSTGVHIVASTGMGPEDMLGGYFLTPQTNPPTPWPAEKFADLFAREVTEGMVVPRLERRAAAGLVATAAAHDGMTATEESLFRGAARAAATTGVPVSIRYGADALHDLEIVLDERLPADRVLVGGLDRRDAVAAGAPLAIARRGAFVALDHVGLSDDLHVSDGERASVVAALVEAGHGDRILLSSNAIGQAFGHPGHDLPYSTVLSTFVPLLAAQGLGEKEIQHILVDNPRGLLSVSARLPVPPTAKVTEVSRVNTVLGPIPAEELGIVAVHEHIGYGMPGSELDTRWWKTPEERYAETVPKLRRFHEHSHAYGGGTFVDATGICNGRDVDYYKSLSAKTGVHIVACTGFVGGDTALPFFARASVDYLTRQFVHEITVGIGDTGSKAGVIKVGVSRGGRMTELDKRIYRAAARAALATGVPILTHLAIDAETAIALFTEEGLPLDRVLFGHADDGVNAEKTRDTWIAEQGGRVGFDTFGYETELEDPPFWARPRKERLDDFLRFIDQGHLKQALASADANCSPLGWPGVKGHTVNYIFEDLIPDLRAAGVDEAMITTIFVDNPAGFLTIQS